MQFAYALDREDKVSFNGSAVTNKKDTTVALGIKNTVALLSWHHSNEPTTMCAQNAHAQKLQQKLRLTWNTYRSFFIFINDNSAYSAAGKD